MGCRQTRVDSKGMILTRRFLNLLQGKLALMKRDVWALELASLCLMKGGEKAGGRAGKERDTWERNKCTTFDPV